ncbi:MAG: AEC family transporter [Firmicutes bacterium]|nr:AEC family transporter [Bacillota bacterium]
MRMLTVLTNVLVIFAMIAVGFFANRIKILPSESNRYLTNLVLLVTTPCLVIDSMAGRELDAAMRTDTFQVLFGSLAFFIVVPFLCLLFAKLFRHTPEEDIGALMVIMTAINTGFMGFPIAKAAFGDHMFFLFVIQNMALNIYIYGIAPIQFSYHANTGRNLGALLKAFINPCMIAVAIGFVLLLTGTALPGPVAQFMSSVGNVTTPVSMFVVGIRLAESSFTSILKNRDLAIASVFNIVVIPALTFLGVNWLPLTTATKVCLIFAASFPCAVATVSIAGHEHKNDKLTAEGVALTTTMSLVSLPLIAAFLSAWYGM